MPKVLAQLANRRLVLQSLCQELWILFLNIGCFTHRAILKCFQGLIFVKGNLKMNQCAFFNIWLDQKSGTFSICFVRNWSLFLTIVMVFTFSKNHTWNSKGYNPDFYVCGFTMNLTYSYQFTDLSEVEKVETTMKIMNTTVGTGSGNMSDKGLPREMTFNDDNVMSVIAYACLFLFAASGNLTVLVTLLKSRRYKSRVNTFIMHLSIADLIVAFIMLPLETAWHVTVAWEAGDAACRILMFFRALGFYLSSFVLVAISLDRYFSIVHPLSIHDADRRGKIMLTMAWLLSIIASLPQVSQPNSLITFQRLNLTF